MGDANIYSCAHTDEGTTYPSLTASGTNIGLNTWPNDETHGCVKGHYCPRGTNGGTLPVMACPKGTYNGNFARKDRSDCIQAEPGNYVDTVG